jgi:hypothetical protein
MTRFRTTLWLIAFWLCSGGLVAQQVWKVDCSGSPGSHFTDLPAAVAAAVPGDTILVYTGMGTPPLGFQGYTAPTIDKPLRIVGFHVGAPPGTNEPTQVIMRGPLQIMGIAANEQVVLSNLYLPHWPQPAWPLGTTIRVADCTGSVLFEDMDFQNSGFAGQSIRFERCAHVVLRGCSFRIGGGALEFVDSNALLTTTSVRQNGPIMLPFPPPSGPGYMWSTESLYLERSTVTVVGSFVEGIGEVGIQPLRPAARMIDSTLRIGATSIVRGGLATGAPPLPNWTYYAPAYQFAGGTNTVLKDPRAPQFNFLIPPTITAIDETYHDWIVADEWYHVRTVGPIGGFACLAVGNMMVPAPSPWGTLGLDPTTALIVDVVPLSAPLGLHEWTFFCPNTVPNGFAFCFQSLTISPTGVLGLTEPSPLAVAWDKDRIP